MLKLLPFLLVVVQHVVLSSGSSVSIDVLMPNVTPQQKDLYLCHKVKLDESKPVYITGFHPKAVKETAHHMLVYTCADTVKEDVWNCGEMNVGTSSLGKKFAKGPVCTAGQNIIYAWAMDAPELILPKDVGFMIGGASDKKIIVIQVHYASVEKFQNGETDNSGVVLTGQTEPVPNLAGVFYTATGGFIKSHKEDHFEAACQMKEDIDFYPFAYRTHAHKLGLVNSGYVVKTDAKTGRQEWTEIGRKSPQVPQMFYPATNKVKVSKGDIIATRCTMENIRDHGVSIGSTNEDEMCNFYIMYYVKGKKTLTENICVTNGPPYWYWSNFRSLDERPLDLSKVPEDASEVPEMKEEMMMDHENMMKMSEMHKHKASDQVMGPPSESSSSEAAASADEYESNLKQLEKQLYYKALLARYLLGRNQGK